MSTAQAVALAEQEGINADAIRSMSYNELIGLVRETNRPPGGQKALEFIARRTFLRPEHHLLEIGCATGWTSIELAQLTGCRVTAIDINPESIAEAGRRLARTDLSRVEFQVASANALAFGNNTIDAVFCGNVTSIVSDPKGVAREYVRVLKEGGLLIATPMYYVQTPSTELVEDVRKAIQVDIPVNYKSDAVDFFAALPLEVHEVHDFTFDTQSESAVQRYCDDILARVHLRSLSAGARRELDIRYRKHMELFRRNLSIMGFSVVILRKPRAEQEPELFSATHVDNSAIRRVESVETT